MYASYQFADFIWLILLVSFGANTIRYDGLRRELEARGVGLASVLNREGWNEDAGIYVNKLWTTNSWHPRDHVTNALVVGPTNLYPMLAGAPADAQVCARGAQRKGCMHESTALNF